MKPGLVTIILPAYNAAEYLGDTLAGITKQSYKKWELIVVEDGTNDGTRLIIKEFTEKNKINRVIYIRHKKNKGRGATRNTAIGLAQGDYIAFLDQDDIWLENHLEASINNLIVNHSDLSFSTQIMFEDSTGLIVDLWGPNKQELKNSPKSLFGRSFIGT